MDVLPRVHPQDPARSTLLFLYGRRATFTAYCHIDGGDVNTGQLAYLHFSILFELLLRLFNHIPTCTEPHLYVVHLL
jgi:hypothetical protein